MNGYGYVAFDKDGRACAIVSDDREHLKDLADTIADFIMRGWTVKQMPWADGMAAMSKRE